MAEKVKCGVCGKIVSGRVPKGGDGSVLFPYKHKRIWYEQRGLFSYMQQEDCPGSKQAAMFLDVDK